MSRNENMTLSAIMGYIIPNQLLATIKSSWHKDVALKKLSANLIENLATHQKFSWHNEELRRKR